MKSAKIRLETYNEIIKYEDLANEFLKKIFNLNPKKCFFSDKTKLRDFMGDKPDEYYYKKIKKKYNLDVSGLDREYFVNILKLIKEKNTK